MKIAIFGYYNALNAGDDRIQYSITKLLQGHTVIFLPHYLSPPIDYLRTFDWILIGGGGLVFERVGIWVDVKKWIKKCKAKIGIIGLGVNHIPNELKPELSALIEASEFFYVRDIQSYKLLNFHKKVEVYPDLTWCFPYEAESYNHQAGKIALNLLPCHWKNFDHQAWVDSLSGFEIYPFPFNFGNNQDFDLLKKYFGDRTPHEFSLLPLLRSEIVIACRFHAIIFAMQIGKPFIAIFYDDKVRRLLQNSGLSEYGLETTEHHLVQEKVQFALENKVDLKNKINEFSKIQKEKAECLKSSIRSHINSVGYPSSLSISSLSSIIRKYLKQV